MAKKSFKVSNIKSYSFFTFIVLIIIGLFIFFFLRFSKIDTNKYDLSVGSTFYNDDFNYYTIEKESYLSQKFDGNYYLYQKESNKTIKEKVGSNPVVYNKGDYKVYLYGSAYQVLSNGNVEFVSEVTEIPKNSPTKFYKLGDRKYLIVDSSLKTVDGSIKTSGYLIIELDKQGNATFANNELNIKTIKPVILKGTTMSFDIANEKLLYGKKEINLKNIIGSTNLYKAPDTTEDEKKKESNNSTEGGNNTESNESAVSGGSGEGDISYYDDYLKNVIYSVNNLTNSITEVNDKTDNSIKKGEIYYDFSKYIALKSVSSSVTSITVNYSVVDSNNEYQSVFIELDDNVGNSTKYYLNKNEITYTIRDLDIDHTYTLSFGYKLVAESDEVVEDVVNVKTKLPTCSVSVSKVTYNSLIYNVKITTEYKYDSGTIHLYADSIDSASQNVNMDSAATEKGYTGVLKFSQLGDINTLKLENLVYNGNSVSIDCSYRFVR